MHYNVINNIHPERAELVKLIKQSEALILRSGVKLDASILDNAKKLKLIAKKDTNILDLQQDLEQKTGISVSINNKKNNSGIISFEYRDLDQLDQLIEVIKKNY